MKKIITITFTITVLMLGAIGIQAQSKRNKQTSKYPTKTETTYRKNEKKGSYDKRGSQNNGGDEFRGIRTYYTTEYVWKWGRQFENTYEVSVLRNGRTTKTLVNSIQVKRNHKVKTFYQTETVKQGRNLYRVTYKITQFGNGRTSKQVIKKVLINGKDNHNRNRTNW